MNTKKKLFLAKLIIAILFFVFAIVTGVTFGLSYYEVAFAFAVLTVIALIAMVIVFRFSYQVYAYLDSEIALYFGMNGAFLYYEGTKYPMEREEKGKYNSIYVCTLENGSQAETMISSSGKVQGLKIDGHLLGKK